MVSRPGLGVRVCGPDWPDNTANPMQVRSMSLKATLVLLCVPGPGFSARQDCRNDSFPPTLLPWAELRAGHPAGAGQAGGRTKHF